MAVVEYFKRFGITTGAAAASAAKAAALAVFRGEVVDRVVIPTPVGLRIEVPVEEVSVHNLYNPHFNYTYDVSCRLRRARAHRPAHAQKRGAVADPRRRPLPRRRKVTREPEPPGGGGRVERGHLRKYASYCRGVILTAPKPSGLLLPTPKASAMDSIRHMSSSIDVSKAR